MAAALVLAAVPVLLEPVAGDYAPAWGSPSMPAWAAVVALACGAASLVGGLALLVRARGEAERARYYTGAAFGVVAAAIPLWVGLFWAVQLLAVALVVPYAIGVVGLWAWIRRS